MRNPILSLTLILYSVPAGLAQDVTFNKTRYSSVKHLNETYVDLSMTDSKILIKSKKVSKKVSAINTEIPYSSIDSMSYELATRHRVREAAALAPSNPFIVLTGPPALFVMTTKTKSYWLEIDHGDGEAKQSTVLRLDKSEYRKVIASLEAKTGKHVAILDSKTSSLNPTAKSKDMDQVVPFQVDEVIAALKPAMESQGCNVTQETASRIVCKRALGYSERTTDGGGESVTATLEAKGERTRIRISTGHWSVTLFGVSRVTKNWSTAIYQEMMNSLQKPASQSDPARTLTSLPS
jgi:hypothetical protein